MLASGIVIVVTIFVLKYLFSFQAEKRNTSQSFDELRSPFQRKDVLLTYLFVILIPAFTVILSFLFDRLSEWTVIQDKDIVYIIKPNLGTWILMALMSSLSLAVCVIFRIAKLIFRSNESIYWNYYNQKYGFRATGVLKYLAILLIFFSSTLVCLNLNSFVKFKTKTIEIRQFGSLKTNEYHFDEIKTIIHYQKTIAPNGKIVKKPHYSIIFKDNLEWRTNDYLRTPNKNDEKIFSYLIRKTGLQMEEIEIDQ